MVIHTLSDRTIFIRNVADLRHPLDWTYLVSFEEGKVMSNIPIPEEIENWLLRYSDSLQEIVTDTFFHHNYICAALSGRVMYLTLVTPTHNTELHVNRPTTRLVGGLKTLRYSNDLAGKFYWEMKYECGIPNDTMLSRACDAVMRIVHPWVR